MSISFDLSVFPIVVAHRPLPGESDHITRSRILGEAVTRALALPAPIEVDARANYATTSYCGNASEAPVVEYRIRVLGFSPGKYSKKNQEYLGVSFVTLDAAGLVVGWSEDVHRSDGSRLFWLAVNAGTPPPKARRSARDCALLTFVEVRGSERIVTPITDALRAHVERALAPSAPTPAP